VDALTGRAVTTVDVWATSRRAVAAVDAATLLDGLLDETERARAAVLPAPAARGFVLGRALLRVVLAQRLGCPPERVRLRARCPACGGPHGPVTVDGPEPATAATTPGTASVAAPGRTWARPHVSVSRSGPVVAVAVCDDGPVGVDVETRAGVRSSPLADVALSPAELARHRRRAPATAARALARTWARKEAALKALGTGLHVAPETLELHAPRGAAHGVAAMAGTGVAVADLRLPSRWACVGAVAVVAPDLLGSSSAAARGRRSLVVRRYDGARLLAGRRS
jgi:4'-phosphopantetheinyl transferase